MVVGVVGTVFLIFVGIGIYNIWSANGDAERLLELHDCYFDSQCVLSADELRGYRKLQEEN